MTDQEGFKVPSLPVGRVKHVPSNEQGEEKEHEDKESVSQKVPEDSSQQEHTKRVESKPVREFEGNK